MLTANQLCILYPNLIADKYNNNFKKRSPKMCLFGKPDPLETKRLLEEQLLADREMMLRRYSFDILTSRPVRCSLKTVEKSDNAEVQHNLVIPVLNEALRSSGTEVEDGTNESEVRHRPARFHPYNKQVRITGK
ncbi:hypothetical protein C0J52_01929 [Blattella germanica]|nr:hypothetical protein C0J52_01929 [Blattella germanica]